MLRGLLWRLHGEPENRQGVNEDGEMMRVRKVKEQVTTSNVFFLTIAEAVLANGSC